MLKFGDYGLDIGRYELTRLGRPIRLERVPMELLLLLVERRGELVTREEILGSLWGKDVFLDADNAINTAISKIRAALRDPADRPVFIKTVPGKGYRFIAPIVLPPNETSEPRVQHPEPPPAPPAVSERSESNRPALSERSESNGQPIRWRLPAAIGVLVAVALAGLASRDSLRHALGRTGAPAIQSLAVLPMENLSGDPGEEYFADGMTDALITDLAQISTLRVISRTSVMRYKGARKPLPEIARELGVDGIVEGTILRSGGRIRITSQLIHAPSDQHVWARSYERDAGDAVALQADVAQAIAAEVRTALTPEQRARLTAGPTSNAAAWDAYLRGRYYWNQRTPAGVKQSIEFFQRAIDADPKFALAHAGLADAHNFSVILGVAAPRDSAPLARQAATDALALDPLLAEAHAALGMLKSHYDFDFPGAQREFVRAIELNPNYANARLFYAGAYLTPMGRHDEAIAQMKKALELDPLSLPLNNILANTYVWAGDSENGVQQFERTIALDPTFPLAHFFFAELLADLGKFEDAIRERERGELLVGVAPETAAKETEAYRQALRTGGPRGYWRKTLDALLEAEAHGRYIQAIAVAGAYARIDDAENAFRWLEKSYENREGQDITLVRSLRDFRTLRSDARFANLLARMGLPQ